MKKNHWNSYDQDTTKKSIVHFAKADKSTSWEAGDNPDVRNAKKISNRLLILNFS
jgi:hypothetical protein